MHESISRVIIEVIRLLLKILSFIPYRFKIEGYQCRFIKLKYVFPPKYTGSFEAISTVLRLLLSKYRFIFKDIMEVGCGAGALSIIASKYARYIISVDSSIHAVLNTLINSVKAESITDVILSSRLDFVRDDSIDLVFSNPPYLPCNPKSYIDYNYCAGTDMRYYIRIISSMLRVVKSGYPVITVYSSLSRIRFIDISSLYGRFKIRNVSSCNTPIDKITACLIFKE